MKNNLFTTLKEVLKKDDRFLSQDGELLKNTIREKANSLDEKLIELLLENDILREKFFIKIKDVFVFDAKKFSQFIDNKEFLPDSYTSFKQEIWLTNKKWDYFANSDEIVLSWPYKDCVLAWWQTKEDTKRDEIFYNEILASDEIDRLLDEKVFTNFKRIDKTWEHKLDTFKRDKEINKKRKLPEDTITDNLLIKWNNLLALHSLKSNFAWKVKLIYIDPPYNTWNDSFKYNDRFNHSTWLTFMKNRLEVAKELLKDDWVIFVQCDDNEQAYLKVLMDEVFWRENFVNTIVYKTKWRPQSDAKWLSWNIDFIQLYSKNKEIWRPNLLKRTKEMNNAYKNPDNDEKWPWASMPLHAKSGTQKWIYSIEFDNGKKWSPPEGSFPRFSKEKLLELYKDNRLYFWWKVPRLKTYLSEVKDGRWIVTLWDDITWNMKAASEIKNIFGEKVFLTPKNEELIERIIHISSNPWDIVLDYHLWSGTTCAVAHKMGRQYIWIEQMDYIETISKERLKKVIEWEQWWISKNVEWKWWWDFVYMEIMEENERFIKEIECAKNDGELLEIYEKIKNSEFINYYVDIKNIDENINDFKDLSLENKKRFLIELLDKNLLYKNYSEIDDKNSWVSEEDKKINKDFYWKQNN